MNPLYYSYAPETKAFTYAAEADASPLEQDVWHFPAHSTMIAPPHVEAGFVACFINDAWEVLADHRGEIWFDGMEPAPIEQVGDPTTFTPPLSKNPVIPPATVPLVASLANWRIALKLWMRPNADGTGTVTRFSDVQSAVSAALASGTATGVIANEQLEYSDAVVLDHLLALKDAFGFTAAECEESMWRAGQVAKRDYSGVWPKTEG